MRTIFLVAVGVALAPVAGAILAAGGLAVMWIAFCILAACHRMYDAVFSPDVKTAKPTIGKLSPEEFEVLWNQKHPTDQQPGTVDLYLVPKLIRPKPKS